MTPSVLPLSPRATFAFTHPLFQDDFLKRFINDHPGGELECNFTGRCPFFKDLHRKKICILIPCFEIIRLQKLPKSIGKTIVYCS